MILVVLWSLIIINDHKDHNRGHNRKKLFLILSNSSLRFWIGTNPAGFDGSFSEFRLGNPGDEADGTEFAKFAEIGLLSKALLEGSLHAKSLLGGVVSRRADLIRDKWCLDET